MATKSVKLWNEQFFEADSKDAIDIVIEQDCLRWINTVKSSQEREAGTDYSKKMATKSVKLSVEQLFEADSKDAFDTVCDVFFERLSTSIVPAGSIRKKISQERESGTDYSRNGNQISELKY